MRKWRGAANTRPGRSSTPLSLSRPAQKSSLAAAKRTAGKAIGPARGRCQEKWRSCCAKKAVQAFQVAADDLQVAGEDLPAAAQGQQRQELAGSGGADGRVVLEFRHGAQDARGCGRPPSPGAARPGRRPWTSPPGRPRSHTSRRRPAAGRRHRIPGSGRPRRKTAAGRWSRASSTMRSKPRRVRQVAGRVVRKIDDQRPGGWSDLAGQPIRVERPAILRRRLPSASPDSRRLRRPRPATGSTGSGPPGGRPPAGRRS